MTNKEIEETFDASVCDIEAMKMDNDAGNFNPDWGNIGYSFEEIVRASIINGQHAQARRQAEEYGITLND